MSHVRFPTASAELAVAVRGPTRTSDARPCAPDARGTTGRRPPPGRCVIARLETLRRATRECVDRTPAAAERDSTRGNPRGREGRREGPFKSTLPRLARTFSLPPPPPCSLPAFGRPVVHTFVVECHCGSEKAPPPPPHLPQPAHDSGAWAARTSSGRPGEGAHSEMYGASGIPELIPPAGPPRQPGPAGQYNPGHPQVNGHGGGANPQRLGQRAPKLGQIGRTKKVDLDDEDLDDIMNNNGQCPVSLSPIS